MGASIDEKIRAQSADMARALEAALREGQGLVINHAGPAGLAFLRQVGGRIDVESLLQWQVVSDPPNASGDCFFTTTQAMINLIETGPTKRMRLVTGILRTPQGGTLTHAWIEAKAVLGRPPVLNVSTPRRSLVYVARREDYYRTNEVLRTIQDIPADRLTTVPRGLPGAARRHRPAPPDPLGAEPRPRPAGLRAPRPGPEHGHGEPRGRAALGRLRLSVADAPHRFNKSCENKCHNLLDEIA